MSSYIQYYIVLSDEDFESFTTEVSLASLSTHYLATVTDGRKIYHCLSRRIPEYVPTYTRSTLLINFPELEGSVTSTLDGETIETLNLPLHSWA